MEKQYYTYQEVEYLNKIYNRLSLVDIDITLREPIFLFKKEAINILQDLEEEKVFILLMKGGVEKVDQTGEKYYAEPDYITRDKFTGTDKEYEKQVKEITKRKRIIFNTIQELYSKFSKLVAIPFMTEEQFNKLLEIVNTVEFDKLRYKLVIK